MLRGETLLPGCRMESVRRGGEKERRERKESQLVWCELMTSAGLCKPGACGASGPDWRAAPFNDRHRK